MEEMMAQSPGDAFREAQERLRRSQDAARQVSAEIAAQAARDQADAAERKAQ